MFMRATLGAWRSTSVAPMNTTQGMSNSAQAVAVATPCWPAPVSAITRVLPIRFVSSAWPSALLSLCEPVWARSSRLSRIRAPPACAVSRAASVSGVGRPTYVRSSRSSSPVNAGSCRASAYSAASSSSAATSASGTNRPPYGPKWPDASGTVSAVMSRPRRGGVRAGGDQVGHGLARARLGHDPLADQHRVRAGGRAGDEVVRVAHAGLRDLQHPAGQARRDPLEHAAVDLERPEVARVDADHLGPGLQRPVGLGLVVHLDQRGHAERLDPLDEADQRVLLERG